MLALMPLWLHACKGFVLPWGDISGLVPAFICSAGASKLCASANFHNGTALVGKAACHLLPGKLARSSEIASLCGPLSRGNLG